MLCLINSSVKLRRIFSKHNIPVHLKPNRILRQRLVHLEDRTPKPKLSSVVSAGRFSILEKLKHIHTDVRTNTGNQLFRTKPSYTSRMRAIVLGHVWTCQLMELGVMVDEAYLDNSCLSAFLLCLLKP